MKIFFCAGEGSTRKRQNHDGSTPPKSRKKKKVQSSPIEL
jgi:hypothetical protein